MKRVWFTLHTHALLSPSLHVGSLTPLPINACVHWSELEEKSFWNGKILYIKNNSIWMVMLHQSKKNIDAIYKPNAFLTCSTSTFCSQSINSSMRLSQVASGLFNHSLNSSWQQAAWPFNWCSDSMRSTVRPSLSKSMRSPRCLHCGVMDLIISTLSPLAVFILMSCAILGFVSVQLEHKRYQFVELRYK